MSTPDISFRNPEKAHSFRTCPVRAFSLVVDAVLGLCWRILRLRWPICGYVVHIWDLCWVILTASVRSSWSTFAAIDVGARPAPTKCGLCLSARCALPTPPLEKHMVFAFLQRRRVAFSTHKTL